MPSEFPRLLQVFNRHIEPGGEDAAVRMLAAILKKEGSFEECIFESKEWKGPAAPPRWQQAALTFHHPSALRRLRASQNHSRAQAWILHNVFPVGSAAIYSEALRLNIPIIQYIHNFRPFSVTGYCWIGRRLDPSHWCRNFIQETAAGAWQNSRLKTAFLASVFASMHLRRQFRAVKVWVAISDFMRNSFIAAGVPGEKIIRLYHPWKIKNTIPEQTEDDYYLFLGRLIEEKGIKVLLQTWDILRKQPNKDAPRLIIAGDGPLMDQVKSAVANNPRIEFRGFVTGEEKHQLLARCRGVIQPAIWAEPLSLVIYEAYDYAKPVLVANTGGMTELVQPDITGCRHAPGNAEQLAFQIAELDRHPELRERMGQAGRHWLAANTGECDWLKKFRQIVNYAVDS